MAAARPTWSGMISMGLLNVPVKLYTATARENKIEFNQVHDKCHTKLNTKKWCSHCEAEVTMDHVQKGYPHGDGYLIVDPTELESLTPEANKVMEIISFVDPAQIDPLYLGDPVYVGPGGGAMEKTYAVLHGAMESTGKVAVGKYVANGREHLFMMRPSGTTLVINKLRYHDEIRNPEEYGVESLSDLATSKEIAMAETLIEAFTEDFNIADHVDEYRGKVQELLEAKAEGKPLPVAPVAIETQAPADLMKALEASITAAKEAREQKKAKSA